MEEAAWRRARLTGRLLDLIPLRQSTQLVKASLQLHGVLHAAVHVPTYLEEHATWLASLTSGETELEPEWLALYFSIICVRRSMLSAIFLRSYLTLSPTVSGRSIFYGS